MSSIDPLIPQKRLMSSWAGRPIDEQGILRVLNEDGARSPLLWIFNASHEATDLARILGPDQPVIFSRSSHLIVPEGEDLSAVRLQLTQYLSTQIRAAFPNRQFDIGASCQGAGMAMQLSTLLPDNGIRVGHLCLINCMLPDIATGRPALLFYGEDDPLNDPFRRDAVAGQNRAIQLFSHYRREVLHTGHGQYYSDEVCAELFGQFDAFRSVRWADIPPMAAAKSSTVGW